MMSMRNTLALLVAGMIPFLSACSGGNEAPPASSPAAPATGGDKSAAPASGSGAATGSASVTGVVSFEGTAPAGEKIKLAADPKCAAKHPDGLEKQPVKVKD